MAKITIRGKEYPLHFSLNAIGQVQDRYGEVSKLSDKFQRPAEAAWILSVLITEGLKLNALENGGSAQIISEEMLSTLMTYKDLKSDESMQAVVDCINESLGSEKNLTAEELTTIGKTVLAQTKK